MGTNTLTDKVGGTVVVADVNDIHESLKGDLVPRDGDGVPSDGAGSLGTPTIQFSEVRARSFVKQGTVLGVEGRFPRSQLISGISRTTSEQPAFLVPAGVGNGNSATIDATPTPLKYDIDGTTFTLSADIALSALTVAPAANNTALVNDTDAADGEATRTWGEDFAQKESIAIDTVGSEITSLVGTFQSFKINDGANDEYFVAFIKSVSELTNIRRGFFYDDSLDPINRITFADGDTITLMSTGFVFLDKDALTTEVFFETPVWSGVEPTSPATGDYWFDLNAETWKRFSGSAFDSTDRTLIGMVILDDTDCVAARCNDFFKSYKSEQSMLLEVESVSVVSSRRDHSAIHVYGRRAEYNFELQLWDITSDLATSVDMYDATEQASRTYYLYLTQEFKPIISDIQPYFRGDLLGFYHPHNTWRCVGLVRNDGSSDFDWVQSLVDDIRDMEIDAIQTVNDSSTSTATVAGTYVTTVLLSDFVFGGGLSRSTNSLIIDKPGLYEVFLQANVSPVSSAASKGNFRLQNITAGSTIKQFGDFEITATTIARTLVAQTNLVEIVDVGSSYEFQHTKAGGSADITVQNFYTSIKRLRRYFL